MCLLSLQRDSAEEGMATAAPSQSSPKTMLEGDIG